MANKPVLWNQGSLSELETPQDKNSFCNNCRNIYNRVSYK